MDEVEKKPILLVGAGGHSRSCIEVIESSSNFKVAGLIGNDSEIGSLVLGYSVLSNDNGLAELAMRIPNAIVALGQIRSAKKRMRIFSLLSSLGYTLPIVTASSCLVSKNAQIGAGSIIMQRAIVNAGASVGVNCIVNSSALIEHDVVVEDHCHISTGAIVNGGSTIGAGSFIGSGAVILQGISVGAHSIIGAHSLVVRNVPPQSKIRFEV